jgi:hypothetical protein
LLLTLTRIKITLKSKNYIISALLPLKLLQSIVLKDKWIYRFDE